MSAESVLSGSPGAPNDVDVTLIPGSAWHAELRRVGVSPMQIAASLSADLGDLLQHLGIPASAHVQVRASGADDDPTLRSSYDLRLVANGYPLPYPVELSERAYERAVGGAVLDALRVLVLEIATLHPQHLLKDDAAAFLLSGARDWPVTVDWRATVLRIVLGQAVSLRDADTLVRRLAEASRFGLAPDEAAEIAIVRLRPRYVDVLIDPAYARTLFEVDLERSDSVAVCTIPEAASYLDGVSQRLFADLGVRVPNVRLIGASGFAETGFAVRVNERTGPVRRGLRPDEVFVNLPSGWLDSARASHVRQVHPTTGVTCGIVAARMAPAFATVGVPAVGPVAFFALVVLGELRRRAGQLLDLAQVEYELGLIARTHPDLVDAALARTSPARLTAMLRTLLQSGVPIRDLRGILERVVGFTVSLADCEDRLVVGDGLIVDRRYARKPFDDPTYYARYVRSGLAAAICHLVRGNSASLSIMVLDPELERLVLAWLERSAAEDRVRPLPPAVVEAVHRSVAQTIASLPDDVPRPALLTRVEVAEALRETLPSEFPTVVVLSEGDIAPGVPLNVVSRILPHYLDAGVMGVPADASVTGSAADGTTRDFTETRPSTGSRPPAPTDSSVFGVERRP